MTKLNEAGSALAADVLKGDIRDQLLGLFKDEAGDAWADAAEKDQKRIAGRCEAMAEAMILGAVSIVHAEGAPSVHATVGGVSFGEKGVRMTMAAAKNEPDLDRLVELAGGGAVTIVMENVNRYMGESAPAKTDPDQRDIEDELKKPAASKPAKGGQPRKVTGKDKPAEKPAKGGAVNQSAIFGKGKSAAAGEKADDAPKDPETDKTAATVKAAAAKKRAAKKASGAA